MQIPGKRDEEIQVGDPKGTGERTHENGRCGDEPRSERKYLGDWVNELGCIQSNANPIKERTRKLMSRGNYIIMLAEALIIESDGTSLAAIKLFEAHVIPKHCYSTVRAGSESLKPN